MDKDPGLIGNLLVERLIGAHIDLVSKEEYAKVGSEVYTLLIHTNFTCIYSYFLALHLSFIKIFLCTFFTEALPLIGFGPS